MARNLTTWTLALILSVALSAQQQAPIAKVTDLGGAVAQHESSQTQAADHILQDGIPVKLQLSKTLSSADAKTGQEISFEVTDDIDVNGVTVLRRGAIAIGVVTEAETKKRMGRAGKLNFTISFVPLVDNEKAPLRAVNDSGGESRVKGMTALMVSGVPMVAAPFLLLMKGGDTTIPKGTEITSLSMGIYIWT